MSRNYLGKYNLLAVSANTAETALNTEQTLDTSMLVSIETLLDLDRRREDNSDEATGKEEADTVYNLGAMVSSSFDFPKAQAQHFGFCYAYGLGLDTPASWGTGYKHVITPVSDMDLPSFTAAQKLGNTILKRRYTSLFIDTITATFGLGTWAKISGTMKGTGKYADNVTRETVSAAYNATELTLAANAVQGSTAAARLDSVHSIRALDVTTAHWVEVTFSAVSAATPAVITIAAPGGVATSTSYEIIYVPSEPAWCTIPARVTESPLRITDLVLKIGGKWNGSSFLGGRTISDEINSISHNYQNQMAIEYRVGGTGDYANYAIRKGRVQTLTLDRQMRDFVLQQKIADDEYFGVYLKATGDEFESGKNYYVELVFPRCAVIQAPIAVNDMILGEAGDLKVMEDDTYGSIRVEVANKVATYAA